MLYDANEYATLYNVWQITHNTYYIVYNATRDIVYTKWYTVYCIQRIISLTMHRVY